MPSSLPSPSWAGPWSCGLGLVMGLGLGRDTQVLPTLRTIVNRVKIMLKQELTERLLMLLSWLALNILKFGISSLRSQTIVLSLQIFVNVWLTIGGEGCSTVSV
jgi:hypothetical protein